MIFERKGLANRLFEAKSLLEPVAPERQARRAHVVTRVPEFLTRPDFFRTSWWSHLRTLFSRYPSHLRLIAGKYFQDLPVRPRKFAGKQLGISAVLHVCVFLLLPFVLKYLPFQVAQAANVADRDQIIYYHLSTPEHRERARLLSPGPGAAPGSGTQPELPPVKGATASHAGFFAVSHPKVPDNNHQTIIQRLSPPDLRIKADIKLPNMLLAKPQPPKAPLQFNPKEVKPLQQVNREVVTIAPTLTPTNVQQPLTDQLVATNDHPHLAVPLGAAPAPNMPSSTQGSATEVGAPEIEGNGTPGQGLLILGTAPGNTSDLVALPPGNRYGDFSIAPGGNGTGSPGGELGGSPHGGTGGGSSGGTDTAGTGAGASGGGGDNSSPASMVSIPGNGESNRSLGTLAAERLVFALPRITGPRHRTLLVAAGPMGGGGLGVYGALRCGKIYTVFLPAVGKSWTLQYCQPPPPGQEPPKKIFASVVHMEEAIVPPEAEERFDFKRTPLPPEKLHKYVILKGRISEDGKVADLVVHQGLSEEMDAAARQAFSQWTFKPAMRGGKAVGIEVLVGIPSDSPKAGNTN